MNRHALPSLALLASFVLAPPLAAGNGNKPDLPPCDGLGTYMATLPVEPLSDTEKAGLLFTREEEKLARDVYVALAAKWGHRVFTNIAAAEQQHMDAVLFLLNRYTLADPAAGQAPGAFANAQLGALYVSLVEKGSASLVDAFAVGATVEDLDLDDVGQLLEGADNADVDTLLQNLAKGSRNHLRSFVALLAAEGVTYAPQYIDAAEFEEIVTTPPERRVVYDAAGEPVEGIPAGPCEGVGPANGPGPGNGPGPTSGSGPSAGPGPTGEPGAGGGPCDGTGPGTGTGPGGTGPGTGGTGPGGNGPGGKP